MDKIVRKVPRSHIRRKAETQHCWKIPTAPALQRVFTHLIRGSANLRAGGISSALVDYMVRMDYMEVMDFMDDAVGKYISRC